MNDNGDVWASADIVGQLASISGSRFYAKTQNGAETAAVNVTDDVYNTSGSGWWNIEVNRVTKIPTVVYNDIEMPVSGTRTWTFAASACTLNNY